MSVATIDFEDKNDFNHTINFETILKLRALEERIQTVFEMLGTNQTLLKSLLKMNKDLFSEGLYDERERMFMENALRSITLRISGYRNSASSLRKRVSGINKLVCDRVLLNRIEG